MKGKDTALAQKQQSAAAVAQQRKRGPGQAFIPDHRPESVAQQNIQDLIQCSPMMVSQRMELDHVMGVAQRAPEEEELLQGKFAIQRQPEEEELLQGNFAKPSLLETQGAKESVKQHKAIQRMDNNTGIPDQVKDRMETLHQADFSNVRVHADSSQAPAVGALAYTQGNDIHFAPGQFRPNTDAGRNLLGHELTHVVQQRQGRVKQTIEVGGMPVNDEVSLEKEADAFGRQA